MRTTITLTAFTIILVGCANVDSRSTSHDDMNHSTHGSMTMDDMTASLEGKTGDLFDDAFLRAMIEHHRGAIDMARLAKENARHEEIRDMADDIIETQQQEIDQMIQWLSDWGYLKCTNDGCPFMDLLKGDQ